MARAKVDLPAAEALLALADDEHRLAVTVTPGARTEALLIDQGKVLAKVRARPRDGAANAAVIALLAKAAGCSPTKIALLRGATSRARVFQFDV